MPRRPGRARTDGRPAQENESGALLGRPEPLTQRASERRRGVRHSPRGRGHQRVVEPRSDCVVHRH
jgi:hypothetical protein